MWGNLARGQHGVVSRAQLLSLGISAQTIVAMCGRGELVVQSAGVYLVRGAPLTYRARLWVAVLGTNGVLAYATAGHLWGVLDEPSPTIHVSVAHSRRITIPPGVCVRRTRTAVPVAHRAELPVTTRTWTVLDVIADLRPAAATTFADRAVQRGWLDIGDIADRLRDHPHRRGNPVLRQIAPAVSDGAAANSERKLHRLLRRAGITGWLPNYPIWHDGELVAVADVALPERRLIIEVDGMAFHTDAERFARDRHRQNDLVSLGWTVVRFTWADLTHRPGYVLATLRGLGSI